MTEGPGAPCCRADGGRPVNLSLPTWDPSLPWWAWDVPGDLGQIACTLWISVSLFVHWGCSVRWSHLGSTLTFSHCPSSASSVSFIPGRCPGPVPARCWTPEPMESLGLAANAGGTGREGTGRRGVCGGEEEFSSVCANSIHFLLFLKASDVTHPSSLPPFWPIFSWPQQHPKRLPDLPAWRPCREVDRG